MLPAGAYWSPNSYVSGCTSAPAFFVYGKPLTCTGDTQGNPCNVNTGDKIESETDYKDDWLTYSRTYHSLVNTHTSNLGNNWTHNFSAHLVVAPSNNTVISGYVTANGYHEPMTLSSGTYVPSTSTKGKTQIVSLGTEWELRRGGSLDYFDLQGKLIRRELDTGPILSLTYDSVSGLLDSVQDESGRSLSFTYDLNNNIDVVTRPDGLTITYQYDANNNNLTQVDYPDSTQKIYHYEDTTHPNHLTGITDERGNRSTYAFDAITGQATSSIPVGGVKTKTFDYQSQKTIVTDSMSRVREYAFDANNIHILSVTDVCNGTGCTADSVKSNAWSGNNQTQVDDNGQQTSFGSFDTTGRAGYRVDAYSSTEARRTDFEYDTRFSNRITEKREPSVINSTPANACLAGTDCQLTNSTYDDDGNLLSRTVSGFQPDSTPISRTTSWQYLGPYGQLSQIDGPRTDVTDITTLAYYLDASGEGDNRGRLMNVTLANGTVQRNNIQYSATGKILSETRTNGETLTYSYYLGNDRLETLTTTQGVNTQTTQFTYLATGEVETITAAFGAAEATTTTFTYDAAKQLTRITDALGNYIQYTYDSEGNQTAEDVYDASDVLGRNLSKTYDRFNRLDLTQRNASTDDSDFAADGTLDTSTDGNGVVTDYSYDNLRRLTSSIQDMGVLNITTQYVYDVADRLVQVIDPESLSTDYSYDDLGNLLSQSSPDTGVTNYSYDTAGNRVSQTDARGITMSYSYDALNRLTLIDYPTDTDITYTYDENSNGQNGVGRLTTTTDQSGTTTYRYGARGNLTRQTNVQDGISFTTDYVYNSRDELVQMTYPSGRTVDYTLNGLGQINTASTTQSGVTQTLVSGSSYLPFGPMDAMTYGNGLTHSRTFDADHRLTNLQTGTVQDLSYGFDFANNITQQLDNLDSNLTETYQYDGLDRLSQGSGEYGAKVYNYNGIGDRINILTNGIAKNYHYESGSHRLGQILSGTSETFTYDNNGNTTSTNNFDFIYGDNNRLSDVVGIAQYVYNGQSQRVKKTGPQTTYYHYDQAGQLISESDAAGTTEKEYVYLDGQLLAVLEEVSAPPPNQPPVGAPLIIGTATQGQTLSADASGISDADGLGAFSYQWQGAGSDITGATGSSYGLTPAEIGQTITVVVRYTDGGGTLESVPSAATAAVTSANTGPVINDASTSLAEDVTTGTVVYDVDDVNTGNDTDQDGDALSYSIVGGNTGSAFAISAATGVLTSATNVDYETTTQYILTVQADDGNGLQDTAQITIDVTAVNDNAPVITSSNTASVAENSTAVITLTATDADLPGDTLTYSLSGGADQGAFGIVGNIVSFNTAPDFEVPTDTGSNNIYNVDVSVGDGLNTTVQALTVTVTDVNENGSNNAPVVTISAPGNGTSVTQGTSITFSGTASDTEDGDISASIQWSSSVDGAMNTGASINTSTLSVNTHTITATVTDSSSVSTTDTISVTVTTANSTILLDVLISDTNDDAEETLASGIVYVNSDDLEMVNNAGDLQAVGMRFTDITIPVGAIITNAYIQFQADEVDIDPASLIVHGDASDDAQAFSGTNSEITNRAQTTASASWPAATWDAIGDAGTEQRTPDLTAVIQEIVNRPGWTPGNAVALIVTGSGKRVAESYDGTAAPLLHVEYSDTNTAPTLNITTPSDGTSVTQGTSITFSGTANDTQDGDLGASIQWTSDINGVIGTGASIDISSLSVNTHTITVSVADSGGASDTETISVTVTAASNSTILDVPISDTNDDAEETLATGSVYLNSDDLEMVNNGGDLQAVGMRFAGVTIPVGAVITNAYIQFQADEVDTSPASLMVSGEATHDAQAFSGTNSEITNRTQTTASVSWTPATWNAVEDAGVAQRTPDLTAVIQEIVNNPAWSSGNAVALIVTGSGKRVAESYDGGAAPILHLEYQ